MLKYYFDGQVLTTEEHSMSFIGTTVRKFYCNILSWERFELNEKTGERYAIQHVKEEHRLDYLDRVERARLQKIKEDRSKKITVELMQARLKQECTMALYNKEYKSIRDSVPDNASDKEYTDLINKRCIELNCKYEFYGYKYIDGKPTHNTERGMCNIKNLFNETKDKGSMNEEVSSN